MTKRLLAALLFLAATLPLHAAGFADLTRAIDSLHGVKKVWIPFLGVARLGVWMIHPQGVRDFQLAVFEVDDHVDPRTLQQLMRDKVGPGFKPLVQVRSRKGEWSFIYARPHSDSRIELVILAHDDDDTALVRVDVDADVLARELDNPRGVVHIARH